MTKSRIDRRALAKTLTWRFFATATTILIAFIFTGSFVVSLGIGTLEVILKTILYYIHEKVWDRVGFARDEMVDS